jgi:hypothetical protein
MPRRLSSLYAARNVNGTRVEQEFFGEGGLSGVRVGNDGEGATAANFLGNGQLRHHESLTHPQPNALRSSCCPAGMALRRSWDGVCENRIVDTRVLGLLHALEAAFCRGT